MVYQNTIGSIEICMYECGSVVEMGLMVSLQAQEFAGNLIVATSENIRKDGESAILTNRHQYQHTFVENFLHDNIKAFDTTRRAVNSFAIVQ